MVTDTLNVLDDLGRKYGTTKARYPGCKHNYLPFYEQFLAPLRARQITLLEIGILEGKSLLMWRDYFPHGKIVGMDIEQQNPSVWERIEVEQGDQNNLADLERVSKKHGPFDVIVDDAGHVPAHQRFCYEHMLYQLKPGGLYILEDLFGNDGPFEDPQATDHLLNMANRVIFSNSGIVESIAFSSGTSVTRIRD